MSNVTIPNSFTPNTPANPTQVNANFNEIANVINGALGDTNIDPAQPLQPSKIEGVALIESNLKSLNFYNIIRNPFLIGLTSPLYVQQWVLNTNATLTLNDTTVSWGVNSVHDANASDIWVIQQTIGTSLNTSLLLSDIHFVPGQTYIVSAWVKTTSGSSSVYIAAQNATTYASGNTNLNNSGNTTYHTGGGGWEQIYSIFTVPSGCDQVNIALVKPANSTDVAVSSFGLSEGSLPVPIQYSAHELPNGGTNPDININSFGLSDYIVSGLTIPTSSSLSTTIASGVAFLNGVQLAVASDSGYTYPASSDSYVDLNKYTLKFAYPHTTNGGSAPALTANSIRIAKVVTSSSAVTSVTQSGFDPNYVWIYPTSPVSNISVYQLAQMKYKCRVHLSTNQSLPNTTPTNINLDTVDWDTNNNFNTSTHLYTCPITGYYLVSGIVANSAYAGGTRNPFIVKNGSGLAQVCTVNPDGSNVVMVLIQDTVYCNAGDTLTIGEWQNSGTTINFLGTNANNINCSMSINFISS